jgi:hypothetical protein
MAAAPPRRAAGRPLLASILQLSKAVFELAFSSRNRPREPKDRLMHVIQILVAVVLGLFLY